VWVVDLGLLTLVRHHGADATRRAREIRPKPVSDTRANV